MILSVFGPLTYPHRSEFEVALGNHLALYRNDYDAILLEDAWMLRSVRSWECAEDISFADFDSLWPDLSRADQAVAALNNSQAAFFALPSDASISPNRHTTLIGFAIVAMGLERRVFTNNYEALGKLTAKYLEESGSAPRSK